MSPQQPRAAAVRDWSKVRVWWVARHRRLGTTHLAITLTGRRRMTRCGVVMTIGKRDYLMYTWERAGKNPPMPSCSHCRARFMATHPSLGNGGLAPRDEDEREPEGQTDAAAPGTCFPPHSVT